MSRKTYPHNKVSYWRCYSLEDICNVFKDKGLHIQTIRGWMKRGELKPIDNSKPILIYGFELIAFLKKHNGKNKSVTAFNEMFCMKCKDARRIFHRRITIEQSQAKFIRAKGLCCECKTVMVKSYKIDAYQELKRVFNVGEILELYDCEQSTCKTHLQAQKEMPLNESAQIGFDF